MASTLIVIFTTASKSVLESNYLAAWCFADVPSILTMSIMLVVCQWYMIHKHNSDGPLHPYAKNDFPSCRAVSFEII